MALRQLGQMHMSKVNQAIPAQRRPQTRWLRAAGFVSLFAMLFGCLMVICAIMGAIQARWRPLAVSYGWETSSHRHNGYLSVHLFHLSASHDSVGQVKNSISPNVQWKLNGGFTNPNGLRLGVNFYRHADGGVSFLPQWRRFSWEWAGVATTRTQLTAPYLFLAIFGVSTWLLARRLLMLIRRRLPSNARPGGFDVARGS